MKTVLSFLLVSLSAMVRSQTLQLHCDLRHTVDPQNNAKNFPTLYFEYFKIQDSGTSFIKPGSFLLKMQADYFGQKNNLGKFYMQLSQTIRCWVPKVFVNLQYSGGLGVTEPRQYSYYISNTYSVGISSPFKWHTAYLTAVLNYKYVPYEKGSHDPLLTFYWWQGLFHYRGEFSGDFSAWTENKNHGDDITRNLRGKQFSFFAEPQCWYKLVGSFSIGTKFNLYYHVNTIDNVFQVYPTIGMRCKL